MMIYKNQKSPLGTYIGLVLIMLFGYFLCYRYEQKAKYDSRFNDLKFYLKRQ